jgi:hypothetical protein
MADIIMAMKFFETFGCNRNQLPHLDRSSPMKSEAATAEIQKAVIGLAHQAALFVRQCRMTTTRVISGSIDS